MILTEATFLLYAAQQYDNPHCADVVEFEEDIKRFQYLRKLFGRYRQDNDLKERLILNHLIIIYNVFGPEATNMLFMRLHEYHDYLKPFVEYLNFMPLEIRYDDIVLSKDNIASDKHIEEKLKGI
jgi:hypothetical protein